jgi:hypothetical protein
MVYFWLDRVRDNRPLEGSPGVVSQPYGNWLANWPEMGKPRIRRFIKSQAYAMRQSFLAYLAADPLKDDL